MQDNINTILKCLCMNLYSMIIFMYIKNCNKLSVGKKIEVVFLIICSSILYPYLRKITDITMSIILICLFQSILLRFIIKLRFSNIVIATVVANALSHILFVISVTIEFIIQQFININDSTINIVLTMAFEYGLVCIILKIKRLKNYLTSSRFQNEYIELTIINIAMIIVLVYGLISYNNEQIYQYLYVYYIALGVLLFLIVQKTITMYYKQKLIDDTINDYKKELQERDKEIERLTSEAFNVSKINHEFYNRQKSLENMVKNYIKDTDMETSEELDVLSRIKNVTEEHSEKIRNIKSLSKLPITDIIEIDDMFKYMQQECWKSKIQFDLKVNGNIHTLVNNIIPKNKLETLIGDHIRDAIIAVNFAETQNKEILVILGIKDEYYELCIFDTGIEFEIETLIKLGIEPSTTHKETGGSGIGFMTTFETMKECKASLIIEERHTMNDSDYTKVIRFRFDGKHEYKICSYRANEIEDYNCDKRIIIEKI